MRLDTTDLLTRPVPRYTSYPTVPHFSTGIDASIYRAWLSELDPNAPISLYLHVPYCQKICWYCGCNMKLAARYAPVADYVSTLIEEIRLVARQLPGRFRVSHLHWGGGTPTSLSPEDLARVMAEIWIHFDKEPDAEIAIESDPRTLTKTMIARIGALGFTRASFGIQEFDPKVQAAINRIQPPEMVKDAVEALRSVGVQAINFDLIYGLPLQSAEMLTKTIRACVALDPDRLALFGYAHVPWIAKRQRMIQTDDLPGPVERLTQAKTAAQSIVGAGYQAVGLDHFARPNDPLAIAARNGTLQRNFQGYTTDVADTLIGFGSTSIGRLPQGYVQNAADTGAWARAIEDGTFAIAKGYALDEEDRCRRAIIEALMCFGTADLNAIATKYGKDQAWVRAVLGEAEPYIPVGLARIERGRVSVLPEAEPFVRLVAAAFDGHLHRSNARHSVAV